MGVQSVLPYMQMILSTCNICIIGYAFFKFIGKPHTDLETRVEQTEFEIREIRNSLLKGNDRFREQENTNEVLINSVLALIEFEVHYCETEQKPISKNLEDAKDNLHRFFARNRRV